MPWHAGEHPPVIKTKAGIERWKRDVLAFFDLDDDEDGPQHPDGDEPTGDTVHRHLVVCQDDDAHHQDGDNTGYGYDSQEE